MSAASELSSETSELSSEVSDDSSEASEVRYRSANPSTRTTTKSSTYPFTNVSSARSMLQLGKGNRMCYRIMTSRASWTPCGSAFSCFCVFMFHCRML